MQPPAVLDTKAGTDAYFGDPEWMSKTGTGGVLNALCLLMAGAFVQSIWFIPLALAVSALVQGFLIRTAKVKQAEPSARLPQWNEWSDLVFAGLTWVAIQFGWFVLAAIPITTALIMGSIGIAAYSTNIAAVAVFIATVGLTILLVNLGLHFMLSYLMINFAVEEKLSVGFCRIGASHSLRHSVSRSAIFPDSVSLAVANALPRRHSMGKSSFHAGQLQFDRRHLCDSKIPPHPLKFGDRGDSPSFPKSISRWISSC